jgi:hypothetical protein
MLPYLIAGAIGFGIAKIFEEGGETFGRGGMTNEDILRSFLTSERETQTNNLATFYSTLGNVMLLRNYGTLIAKRMGRRVEITNVKYSKTTSAITNRLKALAEEMGYNVSYVSEFKGGGSVDESSFKKYANKYDFYTNEEDNIIRITSNDKELLDKIEKDYSDRIAHREYDEYIEVFKNKYAGGGEVQDELHDLVSDFDSNEYEAFCYEFDIDIDDANQMTDFISQLSDEDAKNIINQIENGYFSDSEDEYAGGGRIDKIYMLLYDFVDKKMIEGDSVAESMINEKGYSLTYDELYNYVDEKMIEGDSDAENLLNRINSFKNGGVTKKRRRRANTQIGKTDRSVDKTRVAKPVGYRFTNSLASKLRKDKYAIPTEKQITKYLGKGIYKENRKNKSDRDRIAKL